jgi:hypothetical protein
MNQAKKTPRFEVITNTNDLEITFRDTGKKVKIEFVTNHWQIGIHLYRPLSFGKIAQDVTEKLCEDYAKGKFKSHKSTFRGQVWATARFRNLISHILAPQLKKVLANQDQRYVELDRLLCKTVGFNHLWKQLADLFDDKLLNSDLYKDMQKYRIATLAVIYDISKDNGTLDVNIDWKRFFAFKRKLTKNFIKTVKAINFNFPLHLLNLLRTHGCKRICNTKAELGLYLSYLWNYSNSGSWNKSKFLDVEPLILNATDKEIKAAAKLIRKFGYTLNLRSVKGYNTLLDEWFLKLDKKHIALGLVEGIKAKLLELEVDIRQQINLPDNLPLSIYPVDYKKYKLDVIASIKDLIQSIKKYRHQIETTYIPKVLNGSATIVYNKEKFGYIIRDKNNLINIYGLPKKITQNIKKELKLAGVT